MSMYLNPNLTLEQIEKLQKLKWEGHASVQAKYDEVLAKCKTPEEKAMVAQQLYPILMNSLMSAMF